MKKKQLNLHSGIFFLFSIVMILIFVTNQNKMFMDIFILLMLLAFLLNIIENIVNKEATSKAPTVYYSDNPTAFIYLIVAKIICFIFLAVSMIMLIIKDNKLAAVNSQVLDGKSVTIEGSNQNVTVSGDAESIVIKGDNNTVSTKD